jgi:hypothetical protein
LTKAIRLLFFEVDGILKPKFFFIFPVFARDGGFKLWPAQASVRVRCDLLGRNKFFNQDKKYPEKPWNQSEVFLCIPQFISSFFLSFP